MPESIKIFVGCSPDGLDAESCMILEYSLRKHTKSPLEIVWMKLSNDPNNFYYSNPEKNEGWNTSKWATPFSGFRWSLAEYCDFQGKAIYMDSDMLILDDIKNLWEQKIEDSKVVIAKGGGNSWRYCVSLWDCAKLHKIIPPLNEAKKVHDFHHYMLNYFALNVNLVQPFKGNWNCVDGEDLPVDKINILHYSDMGTQLHHKYTQQRLNKSKQKHWFDGETKPHPRKDLQELFDKYYQEALDNGYTVESYIPNEQFGKIVKESQKGYQGNEWTK